MTYLLVLNINWLRGIVFLFRPKELLISPWILPCILLRRRIWNVAQYEQWNRDKYYSNDYNVGLFYRGTLGKLYVSSDLTYDYYNVREKRTYWSNSNLSETPTLGDKNYVFYDLSISRPLSKHFDFYADYNFSVEKI